MGFGRLFKNLTYISKHALGGASLELPGASNGLAGMDFMAWRGDACTPGFVLNLQDYAGLDKAYNRCSTLSTTANRIAMAMANGKAWIVDDKDNDTSDRHPAVKRLLTSPNPLQTWTEFIMQMDVYRQIYGEVFVWAPAPVGFGPRDAFALWVINPQFISIDLSNKLYFQNSADEIIVNYYLNVGGSRTLLDKKNILHVKDSNQNLSFSPTNIRGRSRLKGLEDSIKNIVQAEEAIYALNKDRGALGILSPDNNKDGLVLTPKEKEDINNMYRTQYGIHRNQWKVLMSTMSMKWQTMSFNVRDLMLIEGMDKNIQMVASAMGYPYELLGLMTTGSMTSNSGKFENELKKLLYQDNVIPISKIYAEKFTQFFDLDGDKIIIDFSEVECLRTAEADFANTLQKKAGALHQLFVDGVISLEEYRLALDYDEEVYGVTMYSDNTNDDGDGQG